MEIIAAIALGFGVYTYMDKDKDGLVDTQYTNKEYNIPFEVSNVVKDNDVEWVFIDG